MEKDIIEVKRGSVVVKVYRRCRMKNGRKSISYIIADHSGSRRRLKQFRDLSQAKAKAIEIAEAIQRGNAESCRWESGLRLELRKALESVESTGMSILPACQLFAQAVQILGTPQEILTACQYWKDHRPDRPITPTPVETAAEAFKASRKNRISARRYRTEESYFRKLTRQFSGKMIDEIGLEDVDLLVAAQKWASKTRNDFLTSASPLFQFAEARHWMSKGRNPIHGIARAREAQPPVQIFEPWEMKQMLNRLAISSAPNLVPFLALWAFAGIRKDEVARMTWPQVNRGVITGYFELQARDTKEGQYRTVPVQENLKSWLTAFRKDNGTILPAFWIGNTKSGSPRLDEIIRFISRRTGIAWRDNAPRHSFASFIFKICKDPGEVTRTMGTSLEKFQRNYWNKSRTVTEDSAREWFAIIPEPVDNIVPMTDKCDGTVTGLSTAAG